MHLSTAGDVGARLVEVLPVQRILVDATGERAPDKAAALVILSELLAPAVGVPREMVERVLVDRERLQSTGIGDGIAIPHASLEAASRQLAALLICPRGIPFEAIDGTDVRLIFGVVGPRQATGDHLRMLARISRLVRDPATRDNLAHAPTAETAHALLETQDASMR
ncbi:PTS sugar transporter subunit IIA [Myxococcota bacterium]